MKLCIFMTILLANDILEMRLAGGVRKWVQIACVPVFDSVSVVVGATGCATDMDAQKSVKHEAIVKRTAALEQFHLSELRLQNLVEDAPLRILIFDRDMRLSFANKTWFKMTSHSAVPAADMDIRSIMFHENPHNSMNFCMTSHLLESLQPFTSD